MDLVLALRELRRNAGLKQIELSRLSGVGVKTISTFETGERIGSMKLSQLSRILDACKVDIGEFFTTFWPAIMAVVSNDAPKRTRRRMARPARALGDIPIPFVSTSDFAADELRVVSQIAALLQQLPADQQDNALVFLSQGSSLVPVKSEKGRPTALVM